MSGKEAQNDFEIGKKLRTARLQRELSLRELAAKAEVSASLLSQIENGKANPSVRSLHSIADALSVPVDYFFPNNKDTNEAEATAAVTPEAGVTASKLRRMQIDNAQTGFDDPAHLATELVLHASNRRTIELADGVIWTRLTPGPEERAEFLEIRYEVGASSGAKMSHHSGREFGLVLAGELTLDLGFERYLLKAGDSIIFDSATPHRLSNEGSRPMRAIWVVLDWQ